ncbi:transcription elongation factor GreA [Nonlabens sp. MB-3u-79]|mgnify:CR=1 FL=1|jgi:transcription elongation factor GreB|uniref:GreA/GreB family elongation factor n=1 Tax=Nonlabens sp. MB-3u-79 TaxID=2058134 RepID=UPI000C30252F|nr:GreA/GreB family elongation factor [Nonlabens sp. MB-3u-79]AUC78378.1 transcription elongation factor GreA [Nonlabens sp. MB-3u-79]|tara:strand:- start:9029 stop:9541 length:513 start_codon:yes stop_codon:yes gene_type:complete
MSRGFVREGDQEEPVVIPQRAVLPDHVINYVTPSGMNQLREELDALENDFAGIAVEDEKERRREQTLVLGKIKLLKERINSARPILLEEQPQDEIRFGATVKVKNLNLTTYQVLTITGVDEANVAQGKIAFTTPIARAIIGAKAGDTVDFKLGGENRPLHIEYIKYGSNT